MTTASTNGNGLARAHDPTWDGAVGQPLHPLPGLNGSPINGNGSNGHSHGRGPARPTPRPRADTVEPVATPPAGTSPVVELHDLDGLRRAACRVRRRMLRELPDLLERFADELLALGAHVCWASTADDARQYIARVAARHRASQVLRWTPAAGRRPSSLLGSATGADGEGPTTAEEIAVDQAMESYEADVVDTGLDEWIARLADEAPSHLVATAPHRDRRRIPDLLADQACTVSSGQRRPGELVRFARERLRHQIAGADVSVGTADLAVAETGSLVVVTDQPNTRLATALPHVHVVVLGMDRIAAGWDQADLLLALRYHAARVGPRASTWSTVVLNGPRHGFELDGPRELHVVVLDNGRSRLLGRVPPDPGDGMEPAVHHPSVGHLADGGTSSENGNSAADEAGQRGEL
jgi:L-lactate utilization protein LutC